MTAQTILPANTLATGGYEIDNSCRFNGDAYVHKAVVAGNQRTFTYSFWTKRSTLNGYQTFIGYAQSAGGGGSTNRGELIFVGDGDDTLRVGFNPGASSWSNYTMNTGVFRDTSAWYNIVLKLNTTNGTASERLKIFVNGVSQGLDGYPGQNFDTGFNVDGYVYHVGRSASGTGNFLKGYLAEAVFIDGTALDADSFGEFDEDSGIWKPIDVSGLTFGNNGFHLDFEASGNLGNDANGGTDFTEVSLAATDQSTDTCTNNFATFNPLNNLGSNIAYSEGNLVITPGTSDYKTCISSIAVDSGKWYAEFKAVSGHNGSTDVSVGIVGADDHIASTGSKAMSAYVSSFSYGSGGLVKKYNDSTIRTDATYTDDDIIGIAVDMDNLKLYWSKNGTYNNSGDPTSGATGTGAVAITPAQLYYIAVATISSGGVKVFAANFGSPPYSESGGNSDADGHGNFLTAPPSGYFALNTKNLAEYGG